jgi:hypothetical protein
VFSILLQFNLRLMAFAFEEWDALRGTAVEDSATQRGRGTTIAMRPAFYPIGKHGEVARTCAGEGECVQTVAFEAPHPHANSGGYGGMADMSSQSGSRVASIKGPVSLFAHH